MKSSGAFSLLEVMVATAVFTLAVVGLARGLEDMIGVLGGAARLQTAQRELDSAAMRILATSNRISPRQRWLPVNEQEKGADIILQRIDRVEGLRLSAAPGQIEVPVTSWVKVRLRADRDAESSEELVFLCNEIR